MDVTGMTSYLQTQYANELNSSKADGAKTSVNGISSTSSREDIENAVKDFETYFVEQVVKQLKDSVKSINDDEDSNISMYSDYFMDSTISQLSAQLVDDLGGNITNDFVDQIMRNYGITEETNKTE